MTTYDGALTIGEARARYFAANRLGEGGYDARWVKLMAGPVPFFLPNTRQRVRSVRLHDIHHVLTGYETTWTGEGEISAWEIGSGCADHWAAWGLNLSGMAIGLFIAPRATYEAFIRGRHSANLYSGEFDPALLSETVAGLRARLLLDRATSAASAADRVSFAAWSAASLAALSALPAALIAAVVWLS